MFCGVYEAYASLKNQKEHDMQENSNLVTVLKEALMQFMDEQNKFIDVEPEKKEIEDKSKNKKEGEEDGTIPQN